MKYIQPTTFSGLNNENAREWLQRFEQYCKLKTIEGERKIMTFKLLLRNIAKCWLDNIDASEKDTWSKIKTKFETAYTSTSKQWLIAQQLEARKLKNNESCETYISDVLTTGNQLSLSEREMRQSLIRGLTPRLRAHVIQFNPDNLDDTVQRIYLGEMSMNLQSTNDNISCVHSATPLAAVQKLDERVDDFQKQSTSYSDEPTFREFQTPPHSTSPEPHQFVDTSVNVPEPSGNEHRQFGIAHDADLVWYGCGRRGPLAKNCVNEDYHPASRQFPVYDQQFQMTICK